MNALTTLAAAALLACTLAAPASAAPSVEALDRMAQDEIAGNPIYRVYFPDADMAAKAAISFGGAVLESNYDKLYLVMDLSPAEIKKLQALNLRVEPDTAFMARRDAMLNALRRAGMPSILGKAAQERLAIQGADAEAIPGYACYETVEETFAAAQGFTVSHPQLADWIDAGNSWQKANGGAGYDLMVLKLTNKNTTGVGGSDKPRLLINAAIHAREYATAPLALALARKLLDGYGSDADATWILDHHEVHLLLQTNPDGRKIAESGLLKRKNHDTTACGGGSQNAIGVDLNRNFSFSWNVTNGQGSSGQPCAETYRGSSAGSEPEVDTIEEYAKVLWPDRRGPAKTDAAPADTSGIHIDLHSYSQLVLWPWGDTNGQAPNGPALQTLGRKFAYFNNYKPQQSVGLYPTDGTSDGASYGELGVAAYTFELGTSFFQSCSAYDNTIKPQNLDALMYAAKVVRTPYQTPAGPDTLNVALGRKAAANGVPAGKRVQITAQANDTRYGTKGGTEPSQLIAGAEAYIDTPPWVPGANAVTLNATDGAYDASTEGLKGRLPTAGLSTGNHIVYVRARDAAGNWGAVSAVFLKIN
ncbi:MAG: carboxypeptidase [Proteobacteria bacterium]|nr:carboxypeptidase [Pseudomonadota bacterium]